jgi:hypothetical protein
MAMKRPSTKMIEYAKENAAILKIALPKYIHKDFFACWWFNYCCWEILPPRETEFEAELLLCRHLGIAVDLSEFGTKMEFRAYFSNILKNYEASFLQIYEKVQFPNRHYPSMNNDIPNSSREGQLKWGKRILKSTLHRFR